MVFEHPVYYALRAINDFGPRQKPLTQFGSFIGLTLLTTRNEERTCSYLPIYIYR